VIGTSRHAYVACLEITVLRALPYSIWARAKEGLVIGSSRITYAARLEKHILAWYRLFVCVCICVHARIYVCKNVFISIWKNTSWRGTLLNGSIHVDF